MGYHISKIQKGTLGEFSKIQEEFDELRDAHAQKNKVLELCELCDLVGAIEAYALKHNLTLDDIIKMKDSTKSAFKEGERNNIGIGVLKLEDVIKTKEQADYFMKRLRDLEKDL